MMPSARERWGQVNRQGFALPDEAYEGFFYASMSDFNERAGIQAELGRVAGGEGCPVVGVVGLMPPSARERWGQVNRQGFALPHEAPLDVSFDTKLTSSFLLEKRI